MLSTHQILRILLSCGTALTLQAISCQAAKSATTCGISSELESQSSGPLPVLPQDNQQRTAGAAPDVAFFVSPVGNDNWSGREPDPNESKTDGPFATLERARNAIRENKQLRPQTQAAVIYLRGGHYQLQKPLELTTQDRGTAISAYRGEVPDLTGSYTVEHFERTPGGHFAAALPEDPGFEVFVGEKRLAPSVKPSSDSDGWRHASAQSGANSLFYNAQDIEANDSKSGLKFELFDEAQSFNRFARAISYDSSRHEAHIVPLGDGRTMNLGRFRLLGSPAWTDRPGSFGWTESTHLLVVNPTDPDALARTGMQVPRTQTLITFRHASDNRVDGLNFIETGTALSGEMESAAITVEDSQNINLTRNNFSNIGEAIRLINSNNISITRNSIRDSGSNGIELQDGSNNNRISDNRLIGIGRLLKSAAAIYLHGASFNRISGNLIRETSRHGIGIDNWDDTTINRSNIIEYNTLINTNLDTDDTGAVEMLGRSHVDTSSVIRYNYILDVGFPVSTDNRDQPFAALASGIYLDDLTSGVLVCGNRIQGAPLAAIHIHGGSKIEVRDNIAVLNRRNADFVFLQGGDPSTGGQRFNFYWPPSANIQAAAVLSQSGPVHRIEVRFDNDAVINGEDRDLFISKIQIGSRVFSAEDPRARYLVDDGRVFPGQVTLPWDGTLVWEIADIALDSAPTSIVVFGWAHSAAGVGAHFTVTVDGVRVGEGIAEPPKNEMQSNAVNRNIVYATAPGESYYRSLRGGVPRITGNDYFALNGSRPVAAAAFDSAPITDDPGFVDPQSGDFRLGPSSSLLGKGFTDAPTPPGDGS